MNINKLKLCFCKMLSTLLLLMPLSGCVTYVGIDGPYKGKVVDAETRQPLEGVVVLGVWNKVQFTVAGPTGEFYKSVEVLTDKNGEFNIAGQGLRLFSNVDEMDIVVFKAGYVMRDGPWSNFKTRTGGLNVQWDGNNATFMLRKLSYEERKKMKVPSNYFGEKRMPLITNEINKERIEFGYGPL